MKRNIKWCALFGHVSPTSARACFWRFCPTAACAAFGDVSVLWQSVLPWAYLSYSNLSCLWMCLSYTSLSCFGRACPTAAVQPVDVSSCSSQWSLSYSSELPLDAPSWHLTYLFYSCLCSTAPAGQTSSEKTCQDEHMYRSSTGCYRKDTYRDGSGCCRTDTSRGLTGCCRTDMSRGSAELL
jgi:hypothetical protein